MKKIFCLLFFVSDAIVSVAQYQYSIYHYSPTSLLKQLKVHYCIIYKSSTNDSTHLDSVKQKYEYDENGNEIQSIEYNGEYNSIVNSQYNTQGGLVKQVSAIDGKAGEQLIDTFIYNSKNKLSKMVEYYQGKESSRTEYEYDDTLLLTEKTYDNQKLSHINSMHTTRMEKYQKTVRRHQMG